MQKIKYLLYLGDYLTTNHHYELYDFIVKHRENPMN